MAEVASPATLDHLATELVTTVRRAAAARADAALVAQFDGMRTDVEASIKPIQEAMVVFDAPQFNLPPEQRQELIARKAWLASQLAKVREALVNEPASVRRGSLWRETKKAIETLVDELADARSQSYEALLAPFAERDGELLESLPPGMSEVDEYRAAIEAFETRREVQPRSHKDVADAETAGRRLRDVRERVVNEAVPIEFQDQWRSLRGDGLPLRAITADFRAWLEARGLADGVVLTYRSP